MPKPPPPRAGAAVDVAALYTGHAPAHVLAEAGWLEADEEARAILDAWFAGPYPTMRDFF